MRTVSDKLRMLPSMAGDCGVCVLGMGWAGFCSVGVGGWVEFVGWLESPALSEKGASGLI